MCYKPVLMGLLLAGTSQDLAGGTRGAEAAPVTPGQQFPSVVCCKSRRVFRQPSREVRSSFLSFLAKDVAVGDISALS